MTPHPYIVVGCPGCGAVRVVKRGPSTAQCPRCGRRFKLGRALVHYECECMEDARAAAAHVRSGGAYNPSEGMTPRSISPIEEGVRIAKELSADGKGFTREQFAAAAESEKALDILLESGEVFEKRPGLYLAVRDM
ncbi:MAG: hypothetical protein AB1665_04265 [Candidatus Thermoplasmatota archaeon]